MPKRIVPYENILYQDIQDPEEAAAYLNSALEDESKKGAETFLLALRDVAKARGIGRLARETHLSRESLYRTLSRKGNPRFSTLEAVLESLGLKLTVRVKPPVTKTAWPVGWMSLARRSGAFHPWRNAEPHPQLPKNAMHGGEPRIAVFRERLIQGLTSQPRPSCDFGNSP